MFLLPMPCSEPAGPVQAAPGYGLCHIQPPTAGPGPDVSFPMAQTISFGRQWPRVRNLCGPQVEPEAPYPEAGGATSYLWSS